MRRIIIMGWVDSLADQKVIDWLLKRYGWEKDGARAEKERAKGSKRRGARRSRILVNRTSERCLLLLFVCINDLLMRRWAHLSTSDVVQLSKSDVGDYCTQTARRPFLRDASIPAKRSGEQSRLLAARPALLPSLFLRRRGCQNPQPSVALGILESGRATGWVSAGLARSPERHPAADAVSGQVLNLWIGQPYLCRMDIGGGKMVLERL